MTGITQNIRVMRVQCGYFIVASYVRGFLPSVVLSYDFSEDFLSEDTLLVTYVWCTVTFILCIWPIPLWGAVGSRCAALKDQIPRASSVPGQGHWMELSLRYIDCEGNQSTWGKKTTQTQENTQTSQRKALPTCELNSGPSCCEATAPISTSQCHPIMDNGTEIAPNATVHLEKSHNTDTTFMTMGISSI